MRLGFLFAIIACGLWGVNFIIPELLGTFSPFEVAIGRYFCFGLVASLFLLKRGKGTLKKYPFRAWVKAFTFALFANVLYYMAIIVGVRHATAPVAVLIIGMTPIVVALYGNWSVREIRFRSLILPCLWMSVGLFLVNFAEVDWTFSKNTIAEYLIGLGVVIGALVTWSWYAVNNARFLKRNPYVHPTEWAALIGLGTLFWTALMTIALFANNGYGIELSKFQTFNKDLGLYIGGILFLALGSSWAGSYFWNRASTYLPVSIMGSLIVFETIFGLLFIFITETRLPSWIEVVGVIAMMSGLLLCVLYFRKQITGSQSQPIPVADSNDAPVAADQESEHQTLQD